MRLRCSLAGLLVVGTALAQLDTTVWQQPQAFARLCTAPIYARPHTVRVDIPPGLQAQTQGLSACTSKGEALACTPLRQDGRIVAAEVNIPNPGKPARTSYPTRRAQRRGGSEENDIASDRVADTDSTPIEVYLLPKPAPASAVPRTPVTIAAMYSTMIGRPTTCEEFLHYYDQCPSLTFRAEVNGLSSSEALTHLGQYLKGRRKVVYHLSTLLNCTAARELRLGVLNDNNGAWFVFLDRKRVFSWGEATRDAQGYLTSPAQALDAGLHQLDLYGILSPDEEAPTLAYREVTGSGSFQPFTASELWSRNEAETVRVEQLGDVLVPGLSWRLDQTYVFPHTATVLNYLHLRDTTANLYGRKLLSRDLQVDGVPVPTTATGSAQLFLPPHYPVGITLHDRDELGYVVDLSRQVMLPWETAETVPITFNALSLPYLMPADGAISLRYYLDCPPDFMPLLFRHAQLRVTTRDRQGQLIAVREEPIPRSPFRRTLALERPDANVASISVTVAIQAYPLAPPIVIYPVRPQDPIAFAPSASLLRYRDGFGILAGDGETHPPTAPSEPINHALLVDGFIATRGHVYDDSPLAERPDSTPEMQLSTFPLLTDPESGTLPTLAPLVQLAPILGSDADTVIWAIGLADLRQGITIPEYRAKLTYFVQVCLAHDKTPVLVSPPILGTFTRDQLRPYALVVMELAASYDIPVVDLYSASLKVASGPKRKSLDAFYRIEGRDDLRSATPNADGRAWFLQQIVGTLSQYNRDLSIQ